VERLNDLDRVLEKLGIEEVRDEKVLETLETRRHGGRESAIRKFLETAPIEKWFRVEFNVGAVYREAKKLGIKIRATVLNGERYVKVVERP
jgi:hypothetical protein